MMTDKQRRDLINNPVESNKEPNALRIGLLGASNIAPNAVIRPAKSMSSVIIAGVAARDKARATEYAQKWSLPKVYEDYEALVNDPEVDAIYNALPNSLHHSWTLRALNSGKHVLVEKPGASNAEQALELLNKAQAKNLVLLEAFHNRFHPFMQHVRELLASKKYGAPTRIEAQFFLVPGVCQPTDFRYDFEFAGGALMDLGYVLSACRYFFAAEPIECTNAKATHLPGGDKRIDNEIEADLDFGNGRTAHIECGLSKEGLKEEVQIVKVYTESHCLTLDGYVLPHNHNALTVMELKGGESVTESIYRYPNQPEQVDWYSTYRYQLETFARRVFNVTKDPFWHQVDENSAVDGDDFLSSMKSIDMVYEKAGLGKRV
ncbi:NAD(P)-binding protein [Basidiobolus meristosporus CBS 931.73]|uniref:D-xylose 1-dehydrogenase (NADP(+), D-xylono-1,5-lactone-forming) n=1 Tax=Basidiobolus meristosporus CBS 931.73 TaxID=1314790 RepID=A0A1Y1XIA1_9FUNG|nr:NAD(P)-binding protein [Basidiobolus meristosporus CBS 931.73]|eukprot:ORX85096.1 NAD(P)-binding protein [Basidiobolus meristosporus CBS 931.73]